MNKMITLVCICAVVSGCSSFQPSTYTNYNTPYGNVVRATGRAADNAAIANTSTNCPSCAVSNSRYSGGGSRYSRDYRREQDYLGKITESAVHTAAGEISRKLNDAIRGAIK